MRWELESAVTHLTFLVCGVESAQTLRWLVKVKLGLEELLV